MTTTIIGLDFGAHSIKLVRLSVGREPRVIGYDMEPIPRPQPRSGAGSGASESADSRDESATGQDFDDAPTQVRHRDEVEGADKTAETRSEQTSATSSPQDEASGEEQAEPNDWSAPEGDADASKPWGLALDRLIERGAIDDDALIVTFLPNNQAMSIRQDLPFDERSKVENILPHMLNDRLPVAAEMVIFDFQIFEKKSLQAPQGDQELDVEEAAAEALVGFARREQVGAFLGELKPYHLNPAVLGVPELLMSYALERCAPANGGNYAVIDIGHMYTRVLVLERHDPIVARSIQFGGEQLTEAIAQRFKSSYEQAEHLKETRGAILHAADASSDLSSEAEQALSECLSGATRPLIRDIRRTFQSLFAQQRTAIDEIYICGGTSLLAGLPEHLEQEFGVPVSHLPTDKIPGFTDSIDTLPTQLKLSLAASAALQQVDGRDEERAINLRREEFSYRGRSSFIRSQIVKYAAAAALLFLLLMGMLWAQKIQLEAQRDAMHDAVGKQTTKLFGAPTFSHSQIQARLNGENGSGQGFIPRASAYELYYQLASNIPGELDVTFDRFETDVDRNIAQLYGETTTPQSVEQLIDSLRGIDCISSVRQEGELKIKSDSAVDFHLHVTSECS